MLGIVTSAVAALVILNVLHTVKAEAYDPYWIISHGPLLTTRLDPIVSPGAVSSHVHSILGSSAFKPEYTYNNSISGLCTTANIYIDKSNYWVPQMYHKWPNGSLTVAELSYANTYYLTRRDGEEDVYEFPPGFRMLSGNPYRTTFNWSDPTNNGVNYTCLMNDGTYPPETAGFPPYSCPDGLRAQVWFPHCWDGVNLWLENSSHVAFGEGADAGGSGACPSSHPKRLMGLFYEFIFEDDYEYSDGARVLSTGDDVGYGFHGDFTAGWPVHFFQSIFDYGSECMVGFDLGSCPALAPYFTQNGSDCNPEYLIVDENVGFSSPLTELPGNNPIWGGDVIRQPDTTYVESAQFMLAPPLIPTDWRLVGCIAESTSGRAFPSASTTSPEMTPDYCISYCATAGYTYAGVEYSDECYCGDIVSNGATLHLLATNSCAMPCAGQQYGKGYCGGASTLSVYEFTGDGAVTDVSISTTQIAPPTSNLSPTSIAADQQDVRQDTLPANTASFTSTDFTPPPLFTGYGTSGTYTDDYLSDDDDQVGTQTAPTTTGAAGVADDNAAALDISTETGSTPASSVYSSVATPEPTGDGFDVVDGITASSQASESATTGFCSSHGKKKKRGHGFHESVSWSTN